MRMTDTKSSELSGDRPRMRIGSMFSEIIPLACFFMLHQAYGLYAAASAAVAASVLLIFGTYWLERKIARFVVFSTLVSGVLTAAAILAEEKTFIKIQPSLFSACFAAILLGGLVRGKTMMKVFFERQFSLPDSVWFQLSLRWGLFFAAATLANEIAWRQLDDDGWVTFRVLIMGPATFAFMMAQLPLTLRGLKAYRQPSAAATPSR